MRTSIMHCWAALALGLTQSGCSDEPAAACTPPEQRVCFCADGSQGVATCALDGTGFGPCSCPTADADADSDTDSDADADSDTDADADEEVAVSATPVDILFVVDETSSMEEEQALLDRDAEALVH